MPEKNTNLIDSPKMSLAVLATQEYLQQNRDIRGGKKTIQANKDLYFNRLSDQTDEQFKAMVEMAPVYVLFPKAVDGFVGTVFAKSPNMIGIERRKEQIEQDKDVDLLGNSIDEFSENVIKEVMENGFCASMNDYSDKLKRSFMRMIMPGNFVSFRTTSDNDYAKLKQFIFVEEIEIDDPENEFDSNIVNQYTILDLAENPNNSGKANYRVRIYESVKDSSLKTGDSEKVFLKSEKFPIKNGIYFDDIPLKIHGAETNNFTIKKGILQDVSDMNISVMQRVVDQVYLLHWSALPTPYITGSDGSDDNAPSTIGPTKIWYVSESDAKVGMLEFSGQSAKAHQDFIDNLLYIMAVMGAQILKKEGVSRETATSVLVRTAQQTSLVSTMVKNTSNQLQSVVATYYDWSKVKVGSDFEYKLNDDFIKVDMEPNAQIALVKSWLDGAVSLETVFNKMKEGEIVDTNLTFEQEQERIKKNPPPFFELEAKAEVDEKAAKILVSSGGKTGPDGDPIKGSNLENNNVANELATEQV